MSKISKIPIDFKPRGKKRDFRTPEVRRKYEGSTREYQEVRVNTRKHEEVRGSTKEVRGEYKGVRESTREYEGVPREYEGVRRKYEGVRREYEEVRREYEGSTRGVRREYEEVWEVRKSRFFPLVSNIFHHSLRTIRDTRMSIIS
jgi:hypothetical protein